MAKYVTLENLTAFATGLATKITGKFVAKETGKGLSSNDYTSAEKTKLAGLTNYTHPTTAGNKHIPTGGSAGQILKWSASGTAVWGPDSNTTYNPMTGATASAAGAQGLVPAPEAGKQASFLRGDGTWAVPAGGQANVIETVKVNNTALPVTSKAVNIDLTSYALAADITEATTSDIDNIINGLFV